MNPPSHQLRKWIRRIWLTAGLTFTAWLVWNAQAHGVNPALLQSSEAVSVRDSGAVLQFSPRSTASSAGLIFLPGGSIDPRAYAPLLRAVAEAGYPAALVRLPWRAAPTASSQRVVWERIIGIVSRDPHRRWVLAGHSRGAALSARFAGEHPEAIAGLVLIATTHPKQVSLAGLPIPVTKIYATRDCVADSAAVFANARLLPADTRWVRIDGGNHRQFGWYGAQLGDCSATISREAQQALTLEALLENLQRTSR
jgi:pimeloyl-ACP methyl ester carboxylesterase